MFTIIGISDGLKIDGDLHEWNAIQTLRYGYPLVPSKVFRLHHHLRSGLMCRLLRKGKTCPG